MSGFWRRGYSPIGVDLGSRFAKAVQLVRGGQGWQLHALAALERGADEFTAEQAQQLDDLLYRQGFRGRRLIMALPRSMVHTALLELPPRDSGAPLEQIAHTELARMHRLDAAELCSGSWDLPQGDRASAGTQVMAAGCRFADSEPLLDKLEARGFTVEAADIQSWALNRACTAILPADGVGAMVDVGWSGVTLCVVHSGVVVYERSLPELGLRTISQAVCQALSAPAEVAHFLLSRVGLEASGESVGNGAAAAEVRGPLAARVAKLAEELRAAFSYVEHRYSRQSVGEVLVVGGGAVVPGFAKALAEAVRKPVRVPGLEDVKLCGETPPLPPAMWFVGLGLAWYEQLGEEVAA